jgi:hypothetical protein
MFTSSMFGNDISSSPERLNVIYYETLLTEIILLHFGNHIIHTLQHIQIQYGNRKVMSEFSTFNIQSIIPTW